LLLTFVLWTGVVDNDDDDGDDGDKLWAVADGVNILTDDRNSHATTIVTTVGVVFKVNNKVLIFILLA
jgi:hypothetical protein